VFLQDSIPDHSENVVDVLGVGGAREVAGVDSMKQVRPEFAKLDILCNYIVACWRQNNPSLSIKGFWGFLVLIDTNLIYFI
jgi:hypothetical protein